MAEELKGFYRGIRGAKAREVTDSVCRRMKLNFQDIFRFIFRHKLFIFRKSEHFFRFARGTWETLELEGRSVAKVKAVPRWRDRSAHNVGVVQRCLAIGDDKSKIFGRVRGSSFCLEL